METEENTNAIDCDSLSTSNECEVIQEKDCLTPCSTNVVVNVEINNDASTTEDGSALQSTSQNYDGDIGFIVSIFISPQTVQQIIRRGHDEMPSEFPRDRTNEPFPVSLLS